MKECESRVTARLEKRVITIVDYLWTAMEVEYTDEILPAGMQGLEGAAEYAKCRNEWHTKVDHLRACRTHA